MELLVDEVVVFELEELVVVLELVVVVFELEELLVVVELLVDDVVVFELVVVVELVVDFFALDLDDFDDQRLEELKEVLTDVVVFDDDVV